MIERKEILDLIGRKIAELKKQVDKSTLADRIDIYSKITILRELQQEINEL